MHESHSFFYLRLKPTGTLSCKLATSKEPQTKAQREVLSNLKGPMIGPMYDGPIWFRSITGEAGNKSIQF